MTLGFVRDRRVPLVTQNGAAGSPGRGVPALLTMPTYGGTLAAVRSLGELGIRTTVVGHELLAPARWSRYTTRWLACPPWSEPQRFLDWLMDFGAREERHVLFTSSDDLAFLFAANASDLAQRFFLYQPPVETLVRVLDKKKLLAACEASGLDGPLAWFPETEADVVRIAREAVFPLLIKARTQVRRVHQNKGIVAESRDALVPAYRKFLHDHRYVSGLDAYFGNVTQPIIQQYFPNAGRKIYSITGFVDSSGELHAARAAIKVFQRTAPVGLGLCFETAPIDPTLLKGILRLCRMVGHFGVFEVEFIREGDRSLVIDMNPRFFGQMGFDAARGLPLAVLAYHAATGDMQALRERIDHAAQAPGGAKIFTHRVVFELLLLAQRLSGSMSASERRRWRQWLDESRDHAADASADSRDWAPGVVHALAEAVPGLKMLRRIVEDKSETR